MLQVFRSTIAHLSHETIPGKESVGSWYIVSKLSRLSEFLNAPLSAVVVFVVITAVFFCFFLRLLLKTISLSSR